MSETLIFAEHVVYINCSECQNKKTIFVHNMCTTCSELVIFMYWTGNSMNNLSPNCGLVDAKIRASDKDLPVCESSKSYSPQYSLFEDASYSVFQYSPNTLQKPFRAFPNSFPGLSRPIRISLFCPTLEINPFNFE